MKPPNLSNLMHVAELRYVQSRFEQGELRGPDRFVRHFLPWSRRMRISCFPRRRLTSARSDPFYYFLIARTRYYDKLFCRAVEDGCKYVINIGCGRDTRSFRFLGQLRDNEVKVLECDQADAIADRQQVAKRLGALQSISYAAVDLNADSQPELERWLENADEGRAFVMLEGVSPYIRNDAFCRFLDMLSAKLPVCSRLAYDFKRSGLIGDAADKSSATRLFRLPANEEEVESFHEARGFRLKHFETSEDLTTRSLSSHGEAEGRGYAEDCLVQLEILNPASNTDPIGTASSNQCDTCK